MKIYTRTGDAGKTSLVGGKRVDKHSTRLEAYGTIDELNSFLGLLAAEPVIAREKATSSTLTTVQSRLFDIGAYLATDNTDKSRFASRQGCRNPTWRILSAKST